MEACSPARDREDVFCRGLPGLPTLFNKDVPHVNDDTRHLCELAIQSWRACMAKAHAIAINTIEDLEESACRVFSDSIDVPVYALGFWTEHLPQDVGTSPWKEDETCMTWLEQQPASSVLYVSFGSTAVLSQTEFEAFFDGVICSEKRFLWVFRPDLVKGIDYSASAMEIKQKSKGRGVVIEWAPQPAVLAHPSVGGFLTHCGWNSTTEAIANGVPMLCWPYFSDQLLNARCIVDEWKVGLDFHSGKKNGHGLQSEEVQRGIQRLMDGDEGKTLRENVQKLKEKSCRSLQRDGSSYVKLKALVESLV
ncbi:hypothetical protein KP509_37G012900 [Ceratopteris richardii]|nr:hypothetical protein KP509_37G012900 [Ceratopteris richardii]